MRIIIQPDTASVAARAADFIEALVCQKPACVLGLATGSTPLDLYKELIRRHREDGLDFSKIRSFNLDEYVGLDPSHDQSYHWFMKSNLFDHINVPSDQWNVPGGKRDRLGKAGMEYEGQIKQSGGIDLQLLGIGADGHIGFNEPGSSLASRTRIKALTHQTRRDNSRFFDSIDQVPKLAVTMGIGSILDAKICLLLATGAGKADAVAEMIEGAVCSSVPASALQFHADTIVVLDPAAASRLKHAEYYMQSEQLQREIELAEMV